MLPVDARGTVRVLTGARQPDADGRGLGLSGPVDDAAHDGERHVLDSLVM